MNEYKDAVILAGGLGTRLRPFTETIPKPLLPIGEKAILEIQIELLKKYGFNRIFIATNYKADFIEKFLGDGSRYGVKLFYSKEEMPLGTAGPIKLLESKLNENFLVINGDILSLINFKDFYEFSLSKDTMLSLAIKRHSLPYSFGNIFFKDDFVTDIEEKPIIETYALAGIYFMRKKALSFIPEKEYFGMDKLIKKILSENIKISKYELKDYWLDVGNIDNLEHAQDLYNEHIKDKI